MPDNNPENLPRSTLMHPKLVNAIKALGLANQVPTLKDNAKFSERIVKESRKHLRSKLNPQNVPLDVVALGSVARGEASPESDFDYLIVAHGLPPKVKQCRDLIAAADNLRSMLRLKPPGRTRMFGRVVSAPDLTEFIGLEEDTNRTLTYRMLILGESVSLYQPKLHQKLVRRIFERYLADYKKPKMGVPRFLLNDVLRYWRTLAVDYQAKRWEELQPEGGLRYLKLLISRKLAFASLLIPLLLCKKATASYLINQFRMPTLARITQLHSHSRSFRSSLQKILNVAEEFAKFLNDVNCRNEAKGVVAPGDKDKWPIRFKRIKKRADVLQTVLEDVFFESHLLRCNSKKYLSF